MCRAAQRRRLPVQRASVLLLAILLLFIALILASLVIDYGYGFLTHRQAQAAADGGGLRGVMLIYRGEYEPLREDDPRPFWSTRRTG